MNAGTNYAEPSFQNIAHDIDVLEKNAEEFPFSSLIQYLLLCQYRKTGHTGFDKLLKRTALYFNNYHWLQFQLSQIKTEPTLNSFIKKEDSKIELYENQSQNHFAVATDEQLNLQHISDNIFPEEEKFIPDTQSLGNHVEYYYEKQNQDSEQTYSGDVSQNGEEFIPDSQTLGTHLENFEEKEVHAGYDDLIDEPIFENEIPIPHTQILGTHVENIQEEKPEPIAFEPLHTVDYFASQGIRITDEALTNDKLGTQMKSFTEWLKSMKKLHSSKLPEQNSLAEDIIQSAAEVSNIDTEVLTEAMAEVLIKQDKREKAIEMYNKLSLINPSKSAYFAAKIESIKST